MSAEENQLVIRVALNEDKMTALCREMFVKSQHDFEQPPLHRRCLQTQSRGLQGDAESITRKRQRLVRQ